MPITTKQSTRISKKQYETSKMENGTKNSLKLPLLHIAYFLITKTREDF